ncbi:hypothetical protein C7974DRAFT_116327 [Boeremia exigua]|uniref:uncharacterized protein n=1 Tax=Boeremia exigua TaxID=749465 RepID=UPI001E8CC636|nr:uncharacterized protein C7974DRAFT_116327 [Boeremia exigua]KAH6643057.1 hypothetical protein C7974DRAFT_116327 [Boeremia exigua]
MSYRRCMTRWTSRLYRLSIAGAAALGVPSFVCCKPSTVLIHVPAFGFVTVASARMQVVLFRCRRREPSVSKLLVSHRAERLERFQKWSDTPAAVEVREARVTGDTAYAELTLYLKILTTKVFLRHEIGADDPLLSYRIRSDPQGKWSRPDTSVRLFGRRHVTSTLTSMQLDVCAQLAAS